MDSLFVEVEKNYNELKVLVVFFLFVLSVISELKNGLVWYVLGGKSIFVCIYVDVGVNYVFVDDEYSGFVFLVFEIVFDKG